MIAVCRNHPEVSEGIRHCVRCGATFCRDCLVEIHGAPHCATCKSEAILDVQSGIERTHAQPLRLASMGQRLGAVIVDILVLVLPSGVIGFALGLIDDVDSGITNTVGTLLSLLYEALMLEFNDGQTLGKKALRIRVVRPDGSPISGGQAWGRTLVKSVCCISWIPCFFTGEKTGLHDMAATTRVVESY